MSWKQAIKVSEEGAVGQVYYINTELIQEGLPPTYLTQPFTLNPDQGKSVEDVLKKSTEIPKDIRAQLLAKRKAETYLTNGAFIRMWLSEYQIPQEVRSFNTPKKPTERKTPSGIIY